jgi:hypothetical protein
VTAAEKVVDDLVKAEEYSFINFSAPNRISLAMPLTVPIRYKPRSALPIHSQPESARRLDRLASAPLRSRYHNSSTSKDVVPHAMSEGKKVRMVEEPSVWSTSRKPVPSHQVPASPTRVIERLPSLLPAVSADFARDFNDALNAFDKDVDHNEMAPLSSNAADNAAVTKSKLEIADKVHFEAVLPPSALLSPISGFSVSILFQSRVILGVDMLTCATGR